MFYHLVLKYIHEFLWQRKKNWFIKIYIYEFLFCNRWLLKNCFYGFLIFKHFVIIKVYYFWFVTVNSYESYDRFSFTSLKRKSIVLTFFDRLYKLSSQYIWEQSSFLAKTSTIFFQCAFIYSNVNLVLSHKAIVILLAFLQEKLFLSPPSTLIKMLFYLIFVFGSVSLMKIDAIV
jgi:hypothetical protein